VQKRLLDHVDVGDVIEIDFEAAESLILTVEAATSARAAAR
jgi:hypothetical protein